MSRSEYEAAVRALLEQEIAAFKEAERTGRYGVADRIRLSLGSRGIVLDRPLRGTVLWRATPDGNWARLAKV